MASCELTIELDGGRTHYHGGETVVGHVVVRADADVKCDALTIECLWSTHGKGNRAEGARQETRLFEGQWQAGESQRYPFSFTLPGGPVTYHGRYLSVSWFLRARADVPWKTDPKAELEIGFSPNPETGPDWRAQFAEGKVPLLALAAGADEEMPAELAEKLPRFVKSVRRGTGGGRGSVEVDWNAALRSPLALSVGCGCLVAVLVPVVIAIVFAAPEIRDGLAAASEGRWGDAVPGLALTAVGVLVLLGVAIGVARHWMLKSRLGDVRLDVEPARVRAGETVSVRCSFTPSQSIEIGALTAVLTGTERVVRGSGTNQTTYRHECHSETITLAPGQRVSGRLPVQIDGVVTIPASAAPSFSASNNDLEWRLTVCLEIPRCPDWTDRRVILVTP